ncbi:hypothetical protein AVEN_61096-1 [Araneus ventricosus]|uniref:Uncharacterized protein n=1 Tax=Araneus ventricosus TaxID=182803 RepID=A0A4Y2JTP8_ARAVE|nr:hypothetical protein AVEN_253357-1 [Araneus ventricosus]GBM92869.1 hypothetical protein AVEN_61096-1 [Araneus ventricosus]
MESSSETRNLGTELNFIVRFRVRRMRKGSQHPWMQCLRRHLRHRLPCLTGEVRFSSIFPSLQLKERKKLLFFIESPEDDDLLSCLFAMTKEEEKQIMREIALKLLYITFEWPQRSRFVEISEKIWNCIDERSFRTLLDHFFEKKRAVFRYEKKGGWILVG